ncbi:MAG: hypothetical protein KKE51_10900 [Gammaproteobacteria bacterium]|nr:hypothetical protein [Gammaproteobacteria bacterium]MBU1602877.1 hypothetical protein [Gammaproteobacteria bacterium]MBU2432549.1 hypothetical protein [Gammaproteobacteria bacterium]MBU2448908.1 hypothetical protein [Gammaproteobacteria bacterium]
MQLTQGLHALLDIAENGEWEKVDGLLQDLLRTMETVRSSNYRNLATPDIRKQVQEVLRLLDSALLVCSERKDQIAPLVNAFANAIAPPAKP